MYETVLWTKLEVCYVIKIPTPAGQSKIDEEIQANCRHLGIIAFPYLLME